MPYGQDRYGATVFAGESAESPDPTPSSIGPYLARYGSLGCGNWRAYIADRGGDTIRYELSTTDGTLNRILNANGAAQVAVPAVDCEKVFSNVEPFRHELVLHRDDEFSYAGPITQMTFTSAGGSIQSSDLFSWFDWRVIEEAFHAQGDVADVFQAFFNLGYDLETSINMTISTRTTGVQAVRDVNPGEHPRVADILRELARTALDFTMDGRRLLAGGAEVFLSDTSLILHDDGVTGVEVIKDGANFATDVIVTGTTAKVGGYPVTGRATRSESVYGLVQRSFSELTIRDGDSADANALARLEAMQPAPLRVKATLSPQAAFEYREIIPGRRVENYLTAEAAGVSLVNEMRLQSSSVQLASDLVTLDLVPLGVSNDA